MVLGTLICMLRVENPHGREQVERLALRLVLLRLRGAWGVAMAVQILVLWGCLSHGPQGVLMLQGWSIFTWDWGCSDNRVWEQELGDLSEFWCPLLCMWPPGYGIGVTGHG